jgi:hypothetical protein
MTMNDIELRAKKRRYEEQLAKIREMVEGWSEAVEKGFIDGHSDDPERKALAWRPNPRELKEMGDFAAIGRKYLDELHKVEDALGIVRIPKPPTGV